MLKKIPVAKLSLGMYLQAFSGAWLDHPFWRTKFLLADPDDLALIRQSLIPEVWIDISKGRDVDPDDDLAANIVMQTADEIPAQFPEPQRRVSLNDELRQAARIIAKAKEMISSVFENARMGQAIEIDALVPLVDEILNSLARNPVALISLARLKNADDYTFMHSISVCGLMIALASQLGLDDQQVREAGMGGLLHDLGKTMSPKHMLNKPGELTMDEFAQIKHHPMAGQKLLQDGSGFTETITDICLHHHEKIDGSGYPEGLSGDEISLYAKMSAVCDVYDAVTSNRPYKSAWDPAEAIRTMAEWNGHFDPVIFQAFVKRIGIYPIGALVRLASGKLGVVIEQNAQALLKPKVKVFFSTKSVTYIKPEVIDLARSPETIAGREDAAKWGIQNVDRYWSSDKP
jgi:putative nucleotidyltransferase with HDIG domain